MNTNFDKNKELFLGLSSLKGVGRKSITSLIVASDFSVDNFLSMGKDDIEIILKNNKIPSYSESSEIIAQSKKNGLLSKGQYKFEELSKHDITLLFKPELPQSMQEIDSPPEFLFLKGNKKALYDGFFVGVVGTRKPTDEGYNTVKHLFSVFEKSKGLNIRIVSGLAEGIDGYVHKLALSKNFPNIAFLGCGINIIFPKSTSHLRDVIISDGGLIASEYLPDEMYDKQKFVQRNRLQAALSSILFAIQAEQKSGTAHTVRFAQKYNKPVIGFKMLSENPINNLIKEPENIVNIYSVLGKKLIYDRLMEFVPENYQLSLLDKSIY